MNNYFIRGVIDGKPIFYDCNLSPIVTPNTKQGYIHYFGAGEVLEVLTKEGPQYYNSTLHKISYLPFIEFFKCGTVHSKNYKINTKTKKGKYVLEIESGYMGIKKFTQFLSLKGLPKNVTEISFLNNKDYYSISVTNDYSHYPNSIKVTAGNKIGIYPRHKTAQFESIVIQTKSFYKMIKNGKSGWLDIRTFKEYYDE